MGGKLIIWHMGFGWQLHREAPHNFNVQQELVLAEEALRIDFMLLRKHPHTSVEKAGTLRKLWPLLPTFTVVEYKSPGRPLRAGDLDKLWAYTHLFISDPKNEVARREDLCAVLAVPHRTPTLDKAIRDANLRWVDLGDGYFRVDGGQFVLYVVDLEAVGRAEHDDVIYALGTGEMLTLESRRFFTELVGRKRSEMDILEIEGIDEVQRELLKMVHELPADWVMPAFPAEERLAGLPPELRLAGLDHNQQALALPLDVLKQLTPEYLDTLSPETRTIIAERLAKP